MGKAFLCKSNGGGGGGIAFRVIGGTSAPSSPKPNDIWINTGTEITSYIFSATEPEGYAPGMVWISTGTSSTVEFNALKKNGIQVYPLTAKQYVSGEWVDVTAMSYQGGEWVEWITYLYNAGDECTDITGGWTAIPWRYISGDTGAATPSLTFNLDNLYVKGNSGGGVVVCNNQIDLTMFSKLVFDGILYTNIGDDTRYAKVGIWSDLTGVGWGTTAVALAGNPSYGGTDEIIEIDISNLTGSYWVGLAVYYNNGAAVTMRSLKLM